MPKLTSVPRLRLPSPVADAQRAVATELRVKIARWLSQHPGASITTIATALGENRHVVRRDLAILEDLGVVISDTPAEQRQRRRNVGWTLDIDRWVDITSRLVRLPTNPQADLEPIDQPGD